MNGPSRNAVLQAISDLFRSLNADNNLELEPEFPPSLDSFETSTERYIQATELIRNAFLREIDNRAVYRDHNTRRPVGRLPVELLVEIFHLAAIGGPDDMGRLHNLSHVCIRWWHVIKATPQLYTNIHATDGPIVKYQLERSSNLPLSIHICICDDPLDFGELSDFTEMISKEAHRVRRLEVNAPYPDWHAIAPFIAMPMDLLETADLEMELAGNLSLPALDFSGGRKLSILRLSNLELRPPQTDDALGSLTRLYMDHIQPANSENILHLLQRCPHLAKFTLRHVWLNENTNGNEPELPVLVTLPHLRVLELSNCTGSISDPLLQNLHAPNLQRFHIEELYDASVSTLRILAHPPLGQNAPTLLQSVLLNVPFTSMDISVRARFVEFSGTGNQDEASTIFLPNDELGFSLSVNNPDPSSVDNMLRHIHLPDTPIQVELENCDPSLLHFFPTAASIRLDGDARFIQKCIELLVDSRTGRMACPLASELDLTVGYIRNQTRPQETKDSLMEDMLRLAQRMIQNDDVVNGRNFKVKFRKEGDIWGERYVYDDATARFVHQEIRGVNHLFNLSAARDLGSEVDQL